VGLLEAEPPAHLANDGGAEQPGSIAPEDAVELIVDPLLGIGDHRIHANDLDPH
jgi:hypothetical protein